MSPDRAVVIKLEVSVPSDVPVRVVDGDGNSNTPNGPHRVKHDPQPDSPCGCQSGDVGRFRVMGLSYPTRYVSVKTSGSGGTQGTICVAWTGDFDSMGRKAVQAWAVIVPVSATCPATPPSGAATTTSVDAAGNWCIPNVGPVACSSVTPFPESKVCIWRRFPGSGSTLATASTRFLGIQSDRTDCEPQTLVGGRDESPYLANVPRKIQVDACGLMGDDLGPLVRAWTLGLATCDCETYEWIAEDEQTSAHVRLTVPAASEGVCRLILQCGNALIRYSLPRWKWRGLNENCFEDVWMTGVAEGSSVPASMSVRPV